MSVVRWPLIAVSVIDGASRPSYSQWRHLISHLALGERGWLGAAGLALLKREAR
jgi:hypothetical protein